jgi:hypothetical protein
VRWHVSYGRTLYGRRRWEITVTVSWNVGNRTATVMRYFFILGQMGREANAPLDDAGSGTKGG